MRYYTTCHSPVGMITIVAAEGFVTHLWLEGQRGTGLDDAVERDTPVLSAVKEWLRDYFEGKNPDLSGIPMKPAGSDFQLRVIRLLREIPYGKTVTYGDLAKALDPRMSAQAVGGAVGRNPISILIPCHRVLGAGGKLTGYAGGIEKKVILLKTEGILP